MNFVAFMLQSIPDQEMIQHMVLALMTILPILILVGRAVFIVPFWFICKMTGFSPWLSLLNIVPLGNLVLIYQLAFMEWRVAPAAMPAWPPQPPYPPRG